MSKKRADKLKVICSGNTSRIEVPSMRAMSLHKYLRSFGIPSGPPQPSATDVESIELGKGTDAIAVQTLLDAWV